MVSRASLALSLSSHTTNDIFSDFRIVASSFGCFSSTGQKAIMSALKSGDQAFLEKYLDLLCGPDKSNNSGESSATVFTSSNPNAGISRRVGLVDIASAPQGLQIITQVRRTKLMTEELLFSLLKNVLRESTTDSYSHAHFSFFSDPLLSSSPPSLNLNVNVSSTLFVRTQSSSKVQSLV